MIAQNQKEFLINRIVDKLTEFLVIDSSIDLTDALKVVYNSKVYQQLQDSEGDLFVQSPSYIYELLKQEMAEQA
ncbi:MAG: hypothetical protein J6A91_00590 [Bacteroidales bacterium]|jgi:hypothetical protein|nr:hypothetical protein [Bacteroidales bacterium]